MAHVQIFHNKNERESFFRGFERTDPLELVYSNEDLPDTILAEEVYAANQHVDAHHRPWYDLKRSVSVGDVIVIDERAYAVERVGFKEISLDALDWAEGEGRR